MLYPVASCVVELAAPPISNRISSNSVSTSIVTEVHRKTLAKEVKYIIVKSVRNSPVEEQRTVMLAGVLTTVSRQVRHEFTVVLATRLHASYDTASCL